MELKLLASDKRFENPKLVRLEKTLLEQFKVQESPSDQSPKGDSKSPKCIIFSKTRQGTLCLLDWVRGNDKLKNANIRVAILLGAGTGDTHMTQVLYHRHIDHGHVIMLLSTDEYAAVTYCPSYKSSMPMN